MKPEDKELLLKDLCARLPYGVKVEIVENFQSGVYTLDPSCINKIIYGFADIKPYLRPMSSMTEEEREFLNRKALENSLKCIEEEDPQKVFLLRVKQDVEELAYLYEHHYDVNGLIPIDCAIEVTEENNPYKD